MSDLINLTIDGKTCQAEEGEFLLNVARANDIFVPAICYLTRCSPTLACRLCLVEADGKQVYACNAKAKDGMEITTTTENIAKERRAIMEVYDVNHPLQCGVCDQSGECELQNYNLYMNVDSQSYSVRDVHRPTAKWGVMSYDPGLCIVCEKCVTVCKDMIGSSALSTVKRGADALEKDFKATMPKDAYAMWNKLNKSLIGYDADKCVDCGECISVCPVGAMASSDFKYKSNAWELTRVPASNPHSSDCALMYYETKFENIANHENKLIYRVTNEQHYGSLNGAARFAYDFENRVESKDEDAFAKAVVAFKKADSIKFNSYITNEEALILQKIKEKLDIKLINNDALKFQEFLSNYALTSGTSLYNANLNDIHNSNFVVSVGSFLKTDTPSSKNAFNNSITVNKGAGLYFHPVGDPIVEAFGKKGKSIETVYHKPLAEESILYLILDLFGKELPQNIKTYIDSLKETKVKTVTETIKEKVVEIVKDEETGEEKEVSKMVPKKVSKEVEYTTTKLLENIGSEDSLLETIEAMLAKKDTYSLIIGEDLITHPNAANLAKLCGIIAKYTDFKVLITPTQTNTLGVSQICDLDTDAGSYSVGYNVASDFQLSALGDGNLDMPALNQQEGTFTNIDKRVVPTNAALSYNGYILNDIATALEVDEEYTIDYTQQLPTSKGYQAIHFDNLGNNFSNDKTENRGYVLNVTTSEAVTEVDAVGQLEELSGNIIYKANPINQFNEFTAIAHEFKDDAKTGLYANAKLLESLEIKEGDKVLVDANGISLELEAIIDNQISGDISYVSTFDKSINTGELFDGYRFNSASIKKV